MWLTANFAKLDDYCNEEEDIISSRPAVLTSLVFVFALKLLCKPLFWVSILYGGSNVELSEKLKWQGKLATW